MERVKHLAKAARFEGAFERLTAERDGAAILWAAMHAATQLVNYLLHDLGLTPEEDLYPTMYQGSYLRETGSGLIRESNRKGDIIHAAYLGRETDTLPAPAQEAMRLLEAIEQLAFAAARGESGDSPNDIRAGLKSYRAICSLARPADKSGRPG